MTAIQLSPLEIGSGLVLGEDSAAPPLPEHDPGLTPIAALERVLLEALERSPCLVSFSGGRDSSAILALAVRVARRERLELPIPITVRFSGDPETQETGWQELVIGELGITDWQRIDAGDELGVLGPVARTAIERHGLLWPPNVHVLAPLLEAAGDGSLVTGMGGDELLGGLPPRRRALLPPRVRRAIARRRTSVGLDWLRPEARSAVEEALVTEHAAEPVRWSGKVAWLGRRRQLSTLRASGKALSEATGAELVEPLLNPSFLASIADRGTRKAYGTRNAAIETLFADLLPQTVLSRSAKARFTRALWGGDARSFAETWTGEASFAELIHPSLLRDEWLREVPDFRSASALQALWLEQSRGTLAVAGAAQGASRGPGP